MAPNKNSPLPNPFFTGGTARSPRSSMSGKDSLGMIPSISSLKHTAEKIASPGRRSSVLAPLSSENDNPVVRQLGKHYHSFDDLGKEPVSRRKSPRKVARLSPSKDVERLLSVQKMLFKLRTKVLELTEVGDLASAHHWLRHMLNDASMQNHRHWSDLHRFFRSCLAQQLPVKLILEAFSQHFDDAVQLPQCVQLLRCELLAKDEAWEDLAILTEACAGSPPASWNSWEKEQFPCGWIPQASASSVGARICYFAGLAHRNLGNFEKAIDAFSRSTDLEPYTHVSVGELVAEQNALIPEAQRPQYLETLEMPAALRYRPELETRFNYGQFARVLAETRPFFKDPASLLTADTTLLCLHLGALLATKGSDELFVLAHRLVDFFPQHAVAWHAVGLYYESIGRLDDSRRYLMKACSKEDGFAPAWLMLGHSFSCSGDHDQAVSAYALLARHTAPGSIYPRLCLAMEFIKTRQVQQANMYLVEAFNADRSSPWVMNEVGVLYGLQKNYPKAIAILNSAFLAWKKDANYHENDELPSWILRNLVGVYLKYIPLAQDPAVEIDAALAVASQLLGLVQRPSSKVLVPCAALFELKSHVCEGDESIGLKARAAEMYHEAIVQSHADKMALHGYNRMLIEKVSLSGIPDVGDYPPELPNDDDEDDDMTIDEELPAGSQMALVTPTKHNPQLDIESSPISYVSEQPTVSRPATLRRRLTSLSFSQPDSPAPS